MSLAPPTDDLTRTLQTYRAALLRRDAAAQALLVRSYQVVRRRLDSNIAALVEAIGEVQADGGIGDGVLARRLRSLSIQQLRGETYSDALNRVLARQRALLEQTAVEIQRLADMTGTRIEAAQVAMIDLGRAHANGLMEASLPPGIAFNRLPKEAIQELVGTLSDGSPLNDVLGRYGETAAVQIREALIAGVATGQNPRAIAFGLRKALGSSAVGLMRIMRNETLRAYRTASIESYKQNADVLSGWIWVSALQPRRTCAVCWAMHGTIHPLDEPFASHVQCRCSPVPRSKPWSAIFGREVDIPETRPEIANGADLFAALDESEQREVLGPGKYELYRSNHLQLVDLVARTQSPKWGDGLREKSLKELT